MKKLLSQQLYYVWLSGDFCKLVYDDQLKDEKVVPHQVKVAICDYLQMKSEKFNASWVRYGSIDMDVFKIDSVEYIDDSTLPSVRPEAIVQDLESRGLLNEGEGWSIAGESIDWNGYSWSHQLDENFNYIVQGRGYKLRGHDLYD